MSFEEIKAKSEAESLADAMKAIVEIRQHIDGLGERKILAVAYAVLVADGDVEQDVPDLEATLYSARGKTVMGGFPQALIALQQDITERLIGERFAAAHGGYEIVDLEGGAS